LVVVVNLGRIVFAPLLEPLRASFGLSVGTAGLLATLVWLGSAAPRIPVGHVLTRYPRHRVLLVTGAWLTLMAGLTATAGLTPLVPATPLLFVGAFAVGLAGGAYFVAANPLISELYPENVGRVLGIHGTAAQSAAVIAPGVAAAALALGSWRWALGAIAVMAAVSTAVLYRTTRVTDLPAAGREDRHLLTAARAQWPLLATAVAIFGVTNLVWNGVFNLYVTYITTTTTLPQSTARTLLTITFAAGIPAFWFSGRLADRLPTLPYLFGIITAFAMTLLALTAVDTFIPLVAVSIAMGYAIHGVYPAIDTYLLGTLPDHHRASAYSVYSGALAAVGAFGSVIVGTATDAGYAFDGVYRVFVAAILAVVVCMTLLLVGGYLPTGEPQHH
jgi:MFS family permease